MFDTAVKSEPNTFTTNKHFCVKADFKAFLCHLKPFQRKVRVFVKQNIFYNYIFFFYLFSNLLIQSEAGQDG